MRQSHLTDFMNHDKPGACSKRPAVAPAQPVHAKTCLSTGKAAGALAPGAYTEYVRANGAKSAKPVSAKPTKARERRWRTFSTDHKWKFLV